MYTAAAPSQLLVCLLEASINIKMLPSVCASWILWWDHYNINEQIWGFEKSLHHSFRFELFELNITAAQ